ncbi:MAG TPA: hypothetical protein VF495_02590 [Phenylobacterium sp.]
MGLDHFEADGAVLGLFHLDLARPQHLSDDPAVDLTVFDEQDPHRGGLQPAGNAPASHNVVRDGLMNVD